MTSAVPARRAMARPLFVAGILAVQVVVAVAVLFAPRPSPYGWQMYSAVPYLPAAWAVTGDSSEPIDVRTILVHDRVEIDYVAVLRDHGCDQIEADALRIELADGTVEEVPCR